MNQKYGRQLTADREVACDHPINIARQPESLLERLHLALSRLDQIEGRANDLSNYVIGPRPMEDGCCSPSDPNLESLIRCIEDKICSIDQIVSGVLYRVSGNE